MSVKDDVGGVRCESRISAVTVFARGAIVTRRVALASSSSNSPGRALVEVEGITPLAEPGSLRASLGSSERSVGALSMFLDVPSSGSLVGPVVAKARALQAEVQRLNAELATLREVRARVGAAMPSAKIRGAHDAQAIRGRFDTALSVSALLDSLVAELDEREIALGRDLLLKRRALSSATLEVDAASSVSKMGEGHPTYRVTVAIEGAGLIETLNISYVVAAARWWPLYSLRLSEGGRRAMWWLEALVAQRSGEDWTGVALSLSTADLARDASLPELPSLRLGRAQPTPKKCYRPAPPGLERLFAGYDRFSAPSTTATLSGRLTSETTGAFQALGGALSSGETQYEEEEEEEEEEAPEMRTRAGTVSRKSLAKFEELRARQAAPPMPQYAAVPMAPPAAARGGSAVGAFLGAPVAAVAMLADALSSSESALPYAPSRVELVPAANWLDFDSLELQSPPAPTRGTLSRAAVPVAVVRVMNEAVAGVESAVPPASVRDPRDARGLFDHRHEAEGRVDIPSGPGTHRIVLATSAGAPSLGWTTQPRATPEVFREVTVTNPFATPLLAGPVDVYVDGSFLVTSSIETIDRGGAQSLGSVSRSRIRVVRNVRVEEGTTGLLGGTSEVTHTVTIELTSSLGYPAKVTVVERVPVTDDRNLEIKLIETRPEAERYDQAERGAPVRGGLRWTLELAAGAKTQLVLRYRLTLSNEERDRWRQSPRVTDRRSLATCTAALRASSKPTSEKFPLSRRELPQTVNGSSLTHSRQSLLRYRPRWVHRDLASPLGAGAFRW
ncbi:MAG: DUF4139 domain-containing protein [Polyangiaceae bacterium]